MKKFIVATSIIGGITLFGYAIYRYIKVQADLLKNFSYQIMDFGIQQFDLQLIKGTLSVLFKSDADVEIVVKSFIVNFYVNGVPAGYIEDTSEFIVPAHNQTIIPFAYTLDPQVLLANVIGIIDQSIQTGDEIFEVKGFAKVKSGFITVSLPIEYKTTLKEIMAG
jgi:LEA14-like dessication related protein